MVPIAPGIVYPSTNKSFPFRDLGDWDASSPSPRGSASETYPESPFDFSVGMSGNNGAKIEGAKGVTNASSRVKKLVGLGFKDFSIEEGMSTITRSPAMYFSDASLLFYSRLSAD